MNRTQQLKLLNDEVRRLFSDGVSEQNAFEQLQSDTRFDSIRRTSIQSLYKKLQKDVDKEAQKRQLEEHKQELEERKRMIQYRQNAKDSLIYEDFIFNYRDSSTCIWQNRYYVTLKAGRRDNDTKEFEFYDLLQNISRRVSYQSVNRIHRLYALEGNFVILNELDRPFELFNDFTSFTRLAKIDLLDGTLQFIQTIELRRVWSVLVDSVDSSKFLIICESEDRISVVICKLFSDRIEIGDRIVLEDLDLYDRYGTYFNDQLLVFDDGLVEDLGMSNVKIVIQDLDAEKKKKTLKLKSLPSNVYCKYDAVYVWSGNHVFISIQFRLTNEYGIAFTEPQTCKWTVLQFGISMPIGELLVDNEFNLFVFTKKDFSENPHMNIYKLPMRKPEFLRYKAWVKLVTLFKKRKAVDPYEEARRYLPLNSDIRGPFAADQVDIE